MIVGKLSREEIMTEAAGYRGERAPGKTVSPSGVSKVIELWAESPKGWEHAVQLCVAEAVRTIRNVTSLSVDELSTVIKDDSIAAFRVRCKICFSIDDALRAH
jgi:flavin-binding protein dodecin